MLDDKLKAKLLIEHRPWENEPDFEEWVDKKTGYRCRVKRNESNLSLCGYVSVPIGHKVRGMTYEQADAVGVYAHGGLTFGDKMDGRKWFGFDCAHAGDMCPAFHMRRVAEGSVYPDMVKETYRTFDWVKEETTKLARSLSSVHESIVNDEVMAAAKAAMRGGTNITEELAKRGYVRRETKRG